MECVKNNSSKLGDKEDCLDASPASPKPKIKSKIVIVDMPKENNERRELLKRKLEIGISERPAKEPKILLLTNESRDRTPKNALSTLHEMFRTLNVKITSQAGPTNAPVFTAEIEINGITFSGQGKNKKLAKHSAAEAALKSLVQLKNPVKEPATFDKSQSSDFSGDAVYKEVNNFDILKPPESSSSIPNGERGCSSCNNHTSVRKNSKEDGSPVKVERKPISITKQNRTNIFTKNPVMLLNELHPSAKYELLSESGSQATKYTMAVYIDGKRFEGQGSSKKLSKAAAARCALSIFYNVVVPDTPVVQTEILIPKDSSTLPQKFADHVAQLIMDKFDCLIPKYSVLYRRKVLAGFVLSQNYELTSCKVLTLSTGTKCINGEKMSVNGTVLNDSHAEILSRRALCCYLYTELEKLANEKQRAESIFEAKRDGGFKLKPEYKFHLFINTAPCGDARIFSPYDLNVADKHPNRKARGQLRTKIECGEGTIPVKSSLGIQTWDGVLLGERLLTMSCSDKIAKWNVVGIQGALLSNFIEPIYLDSIILGSLFHPCHLYRAVCGRIEKNIAGLTPPFRLSKPRLSGTVNTEKRQIGKTPSLSVNWCIGDSVIEVINAVTGRTDQNTISRISKCKLFYKFLNLLDKIPTMTGLSKPDGPLLYSFCKESAYNFQAAKRVLFKALVKAELGEWIKKPLEVDQFEWDVQTLDKLFESDAANAVVSNSLSTELNSDINSE